MKLWRTIGACTVIAAGFGCNAVGQPVVNQPILKVGDHWKFHSTTQAGDKSDDRSRTIVSISPDGIVQVRWGSGKIENYDLALNYLPDDPRILIRYPAKVGDEWTWSGKGDNFYGGARGSAKIVAYESITVPAGTFDCLRVVAKETYTWKAYEWIERTWTRWYCPRVKWIAKAHWESFTCKSYAGGCEKPSTSDWELVKFTPGK